MVKTAVVLLTPHLKINAVQDKQAIHDYGSAGRQDQQCEHAPHPRDRLMDIDD